VAAKWRAAASHLRYRPLAQWLPMSSAIAQSGAATVPARVLQGMSLAPTQQAPNPLDPGLQPPRGCCGATVPTNSDVQDALRRLFAPIQAMGLMASTVVQNLSDDILTLRSTDKLRKEMCAKGRTKPEVGCWQLHHIVAVASIRYPSVAASQAILAKFNMSIDDANNGVYLECSKHAVLHTKAYHDAVFEAIQSSSSYLDLAGRLRTIGEILSARGTFP
jgi:hypothetical protein